MSSLVDDLVEAILAEPKTATRELIKQAGESPVSPEWEELANELEKQAEEDVDAKAKQRSVAADGMRLHKLAMATILDTIDDPRCEPAIIKLANDAQEIVKSALADPDPGSVGELAQITNADGPAYVKHKVGKGRTLFEKMKPASVAPTAVMEESK